MWNNRQKERAFGVNLINVVAGGGGGHLMATPEGLHRLTVDTMKPPARALSSTPLSLTHTHARFPVVVAPSRGI